MSVEVHVIEPWKGLLLGLQLTPGATSHFVGLLKIHRLRRSRLIPIKQKEMPMEIS